MSRCEKRPQIGMRTMQIYLPTSPNISNCDLCSSFCFHSKSKKSERAMTCSSKPLSIGYNTAHNIPMCLRLGFMLLGTTPSHVGTSEPQIRNGPWKEEVDRHSNPMSSPSANRRNYSPPWIPRLQIQDTIRAEDGKSAQLVTVCVLSGSLCGHKT